MIPNQFKFVVKDGTGIIFNAVIATNENGKCFEITSENVKCYYSFSEVINFLTIGKWKIIKECF